MNIGWILLICALVIVAFAALRLGRKKERMGSMEQMLKASQDSLARIDNPQLDAFDARLVRRDELMSLLSNEKIKAIKLYREDTGASLADAKNAVERMQLGLRMGIVHQESGVSAMFSEASDLPGGEVERLVLQGKKIQAIKLYREQTGLGLREAKEAVDALDLLASKRSSLASQAQKDGIDAGGRLPSSEAPGDTVRQHILAGNKILAIKAYRAQTGLGLREAKEAVERMEQAWHQGFVE